MDSYRSSKSRTKGGETGLFIVFFFNKNDGSLLAFGHISLILRQQVKEWLGVGKRLEENAHYRPVSGVIVRSGRRDEGEERYRFTVPFNGRPCKSPELTENAQMHFR